MRKKLTTEESPSDNTMEVKPQSAMAALTSAKLSLWNSRHSTQTAYDQHDRRHDPQRYA